VTAQNTHGSTTRGSGRKRARTGQAPKNGKPSTSTLRQRQAAHQALLHARQAREGRNRRLWIVLAPIGVALLAVTTLVAVKLAAGNTPHEGRQATAANAAVIAEVTGVPAAAFDAVDVGKPYALPNRIDAPPLTAGGKPRVLYIGAEYCPYCATERWAVIVALSRFGSWHGLRYAFSAADDVYPNTATFTFHGASYTSDYLSFTGVETETNMRQPLDTLAGADREIFQKYGTGGIPFVDLGGRHVIVGATYDPTLIVGHTQAQIAAALHRSDSKIGAGVLGAANVITASICESTGGQPTAVCTSPGVTAAAEVLP
jgi:hypothetical protein